MLEEYTPLLKTRLYLIDNFQIKFCSNLARVLWFSDQRHADHMQVGFPTTATAQKIRAICSGIFFFRSWTRLPVGTVSNQDLRYNCKGILAKYCKFTRPLSRVNFYTPQFRVRVSDVADRVGLLNWPREPESINDQGVCWVKPGWRAPAKCWLTPRYQRSSSTGQKANWNQHTEHHMQRPVYTQEFALEN